MVHQNLCFFTDESRMSFYTEIKIHPEFLKELIPTEVQDGVYDQNLIFISQTEQKILQVINNQQSSLSKILTNFGYKVITRNIREALTRLLNLELIAYTIPEKPRSKHQKYKITQKGMRQLNI